MESQSTTADTCEYQPDEIFAFEFDANWFNFDYETYK